MRRKFVDKFTIDKPEEKAQYEDDYVSYDNDFMERKDEKSDASKD